MQPKLSVGADISKAKVDAFVAQTQASVCLRNQRAPLDKWLASLPAGSRIAMEATGEYHLLLAELAHARGLEVFVLNPQRVRHYAKAQGLRAKTDRADAALLARILEAEHGQLRPFEPMSPQQRELLQLIRRRGKASAMRAAVRTSFQGLSGVVKATQGLIKSFDQLIQAIDARVHQLVQADAQRAQSLRRLRTISGVGLVVGAGMQSSLERMRFDCADAFVAYHGVDTRVDDSGTRKGRRRLSKRGSPEMRRLLYNAAMAGVRTPAWKPVYAYYRQRGFAPTAALMIIARRILRTAWAMHKHGTDFDPLRTMSGLTQT